MERYQSRYWHQVDHDLSESGVLPMTIRELLGPTADAEGFLHTALGYPLSEGSLETRASIAAWYPGASPEQVSITNGGSEANFLTLFSLLGSGDRLAFMVPNYLQGRGLGKAFGKATDTFRLKPVDGRWSLDLEELDDAVGKKTKVVMVCNPNNPTGSVLTEDEMDAIVRVADRRGAWIVADEIYRGAELDSRRHHADVLGSLRQGHHHERLVEGVRPSRAPRGLGGGTHRGDRPGAGAPRLHDAVAGHGLGPPRGARDVAGGARIDLRPHPDDHPHQLPATWSPGSRATPT